MSTDVSNNGTDSPTISVVVATRDRPEMLRRAVAAITADDYPGVIETVLVFDQSEPDQSMASDDPRRPIRVTANERSTGLAGGRNTGVLAATGEWLAFCDDDDEWLPGKLRAQMAAIDATAAARMATCGVAIRFEDEDHERIPDPSMLTFEGFLRDRMTEVHPSTFVLHRQWFIDEVGMVDEGLPGSYVEDYDVLLRASRLAPIASVPRALVRVWWHPSTYFRDRWTMIDEALDYLLDKFPEFADVPAGKARIRGQQAFAQAAAGDRSRALKTIADVVRLHPTEPRSAVALAVVAGVPPQFILNTLHRFGRGV